MFFPISDVDVDSKIHMRCNHHDDNNIRFNQDEIIFIIGDPVDTVRMKNFKNGEIKQIHQNNETLLKYLERKFGLKVVQHKYYK